MQTEYEAKFLDVDIEKMRALLRARGAKCDQPMRLMKRIILDDDKTGLQYGNDFIRLRDEGDKVTLTYKEFTSNAVDGAQELEVEVSDFETMRSILAKTGVFEHSYQESKRETWILNNCKIEIDQWPWIAPYIEVEASSEKKVKETVSLLELDWSTAVFGDVTTAYTTEFDVEPATVGRHKRISFADKPPKDWKRL